MTRAFQETALPVATCLCGFRTRADEARSCVPGVHNRYCLAQLSDLTEAC